MTKEFKDICQKCYDSRGGCCSSVVIPINKNEPAAALFLEKFKEDSLPEDHKLWDDENNFDDMRNSWIYNSNKESCMFLDQENGSCKIHDNKPVICKTYPLKWRNQHTFLISMGCPLSHSIPIKDIVAWGEENKVIITDMPYYYGFDSNDKQKTFFNVRNAIYEFELVSEVYDKEEEEQENL